MDHDFDPVRFEALDGDPAAERLVVERGEDPVRVLDRGAQPAEDLLGGLPPGGVELARAEADIGGSPESGDDPLPDIPFEVHDQVADAVAPVVRGPPEFRLREEPHRPLQPGEEFPGEFLPCDRQHPGAEEIAGSGGFAARGVGIRAGRQHPPVV